MYTCLTDPTRCCCEDGYTINEVFGTVSDGEDLTTDCSAETVGYDYSAAGGFKCVDALPTHTYCADITPELCAMEDDVWGPCIREKCP